MTAPMERDLPANVPFNPPARASGSGQAHVPSTMPPPSMVPAGWYPDPDGRPIQRYWDGANWSEHTAPQQLVQAPVPPPPTPMVFVNNSSSAAAAVVAYPPRRVNHLLHFILTVLTGGLWIIVWIFVAIRR